MELSQCLGEKNQSGTRSRFCGFSGFKKRASWKRASVPIALLMYCICSTISRMNFVFQRGLFHTFYRIPLLYVYFSSVFQPPIAIPPTGSKSVARPSNSRPEANRGPVSMIFGQIKCIFIFDWYCLEYNCKKRITTSSTPFGVVRIEVLNKISGVVLFTIQS